MRLLNGFIVTVALVALAASASAQPAKAIGVYWDENATQNYATVYGGVNVFQTAYVFAMNAYQVVGGVAFMLEMDPRIQVMGATYPDAIKFGEPTEGVSIGFTDCRPAWDGQPILAAILTLWTGTELMTDAEIKVVAHPREGAVLISDCLGQLTPADGYSCYLTVAVDDGDVSWGNVKALYR